MNIKDVMKKHFLDLDEASRNPKKKIAWCTSVGPAEILRAMDFEVYFPENHGALLGATRMSGEVMSEAHAYGYSPDICSYLASDVGAFLKKTTPLTKAYGIKEIPKPDVLVYCTNQCKDVMHWFEFYGRHYNMPVIGIHPPNHLSTVDACHVDSMVRQYKVLIAELERVQGKPVEEEKIITALTLSKQASDHWSEFLNLAQSRPAAFTFFDSTIFMGPIVVLRGTRVARDYYRALVEEYRQKNVAAVPHEQKRIYWDGMPIWGRLRSLADLFKKNKTAVVASTYCNSWIFDSFNPKAPLESMAEGYLKIFINRNDEYKEQYILEKMRQFSVDGVLFHESKTCPNNSNSQYGMPKRLQKKDVRSVVVNGDLCDLRCFSDEQATNAIEAFLETL